MSGYLEIQCIECDAVEAFPATSKRQAEKAARDAGWSKTKYGWRCHRHRAKTKYNNRKSEVDGIKFASEREAERYAELKLLESAGLICELELQPCFELIPAFIRDGKKERPTRYYADFQYWDIEAGKRITEDVKGKATDVYKLKRKMLLHGFPFINFREV